MGAHLSRAAAGSFAGTFAEFYLRERAFVCQSLRRARVAASDLEDLAQEVFTLAWRKRPEFSSPRAAKAWLHQSARRVAANHHRSLRRRSAGHDGAALHAQLGQLGTARDQLERDTALELQLRAQLAGLNSQDRRIFALSQVLGHTAPEVARALDLNLNTTYARIRTLRGRLARALTVAVLLGLALWGLAVGQCSLSVKSVNEPEPKMMARAHEAATTNLPAAAESRAPIAVLLSPLPEAMAPSWHCPLSTRRPCSSRPYPDWVAGRSRHSVCWWPSASWSDCDVLAGSRAPTV